MGDYDSGDGGHNSYCSVYGKLSNYAGSHRPAGIKFGANLPNEAVTLPWNRLDKPRVPAFIAKSCSQAAHQNVKAVFEFDVTVRP